MGSEIINLNDSSPSATTGYSTAKWQKGPTSGTDPTYGVPVYPVTSEMPNAGGVSKLTTNATAAAGDCGKLLSFTLSGTATYTLPATPPSVPDGGGTNRWRVDVQNLSTSTAALTIAATSTAKLDGTTAGTLALAAGSGVSIYTDGTDYFTERGQFTDASTLATKAGVQQEAYTYAADTGIANAYAITLSPVPTLVAGSAVCFKAANANTGDSTLAVNGGSAIAIKKNGNSTALAAGDITAGQVIDATYDGTVWQIVVGGSPAPSGAANLVYATPNGSSGSASLRALVSPDLPVGSASQLGAVQVDNTSIVATAGIISAVGSATKGVYTGNVAAASTNSPSSPITATFASNVTKGGAIVVYVAASSGSLAVTSITDTLGNVYALAGSDSAWPQYAYVALNSAAGANTVTVNFTGGGTKISLLAIEYQNVVGYSAIDGSGSSSTGSPSTVSLTTANATDILIAHGMIGGGGSYTSTWSAGFTQQYSALLAAPNWTEFIADRNVIAAGSQSVTWTNSGGVVSESLLVIALKVGVGVQDFNGRTGHIVSQPAGAIVLQIDGSGSTPSLGAKGGALQIPYAGTITGWTLLADASGSAQITVSKTTYSSFPTTSSIDASAPPNLSSAQKATSTTLTGWTTSFSAGDVFTFNLDSASGMTKLTLMLQTQRVL